jgi:probable rRNA maturation factor
MKYGIEVYRRAEEKITKKLIEKIVGKTLAEIKIRSADVSVAFVGGAEIKKWNNLYRKKNKVTDVLSFVYSEKPLTGEVIICYSRAVGQAKQRGWGTEKEVIMLLIHGVLHLAGYDHEKSEREARKMDKLQNKIFNLCLALAV